jgi:nucleotide-binding universal stress UspA family protein
MYRKILVPLDGSERAEMILPHVEDIARQFKSEVLLLRVIEPMPATIGLDGAVPPIDPWIVDRDYKDSRSYLEKIQARLRKTGIVSRILLRWGQVVPSIVDLAEQEKVDLVAMASHGRSGLARFYYGSVAAGVLHRIERPLLIVRSTLLEQANRVESEAKKSA